MMYTVLIADDEPLVQIGLKSMLARGFGRTDTDAGATRPADPTSGADAHAGCDASDSRRGQMNSMQTGSFQIEVAGTAANGREALAQIGQLQPDIVIADIRMPVMNGLELLEESGRLFGRLPVFIMLTAYEEFDLVRRAMAGGAVDYLVKIELNQDLLGEALMKACRRIDEIRGTGLLRERSQPSLEEFRQKFMLRLLDRQITDRQAFETQAADLGLDFHYDRYIVVYGHILSGLFPDDGTAQTGEEAQNRMLVLYSSCLNMTKEIVSRYVPCHTVSNDMRHFTLIFHFEADEAVAQVSSRIQEAIANARDMIASYFNLSMFFGIGTAVTDPMQIAVSFEEARIAQEQADDSRPVRLFSHIVGARRRSGKDQLIARVQAYINDNLDGRLLLNEVAEVFGLSPAYLSVIFKKNADIGFSEYVNTRKIEKAKQMLLSGDMKIYEVADALGYESAFYFSKVFKKIDGKSPREYIQSKQEGTPDSGF